jgi:hypothetical protein
MRKGKRRKEGGGKEDGQEGDVEKGRGNVN